MFKCYSEALIFIFNNLICIELTHLSYDLPPYSTHRLQFLDSSLFLALATAYSEEITNIMQKSEGIVSLINKGYSRVALSLHGAREEDPARVIRQVSQLTSFWPIDLVK